MSARILSTIFATTILMAACSGNDYEARYFHLVEGNAHVTGGIALDAPLDSLSIPYGAASISGATGELQLAFSVGEGELSATINEPTVGRQVVDSVRFRLPGDGSTQDFECRLFCGPCTVDLTSFSDDAISGTLACAGLRHCGEPTPLPPPEGDAACGGRRSSIIDVSADFTLGQASDSRLDY